MWICKYSGCCKEVSPTAEGIKAHYKKYHPSDYSANLLNIEKYPKAFAKEIDEEELQKIKEKEHENNYTYTEIISNIAKYADIVETQTVEIRKNGGEEFVCKGCMQTKRHGIRIKRSQHVYVDFCNSCCKIAKEYVRQGKKPRIKIISTPQNGLNRFDKRR